LKEERDGRRGGHSLPIKAEILGVWMPKKKKKGSSSMNIRKKPKQTGHPVETKWG